MSEGFYNADKCTCQHSWKCPVCLDTSRVPEIQKVDGSVESGKLLLDIARKYEELKSRHYHEIQLFVRTHKMSEVFMDAIIAHAHQKDNNHDPRLK